MQGIAVIGLPGRIIKINWQLTSPMVIGPVANKANRTFTICLFLCIYFGSMNFANCFFANCQLLRLGPNSRQLNIELDGNNADDDNKT